jgi:AcrR family transcriptional regulator
MVTAVPVVTRPDTPERILQAAFDCIRDVGLSRTTVEDVARAAGLSRQTIYRYFPSKDHMVMALVLREEEKFLDGIRAAFAAAPPDLEHALRDSILFCLRFAREHPLLDRLLASDPETLLPFLTIKSGPVIDRAREVLVELIGTKAWVRTDVYREAADAAVRVVISHALAPPKRRVDDVAADLARILALALTAKEATRR